ncbi:MAG: hypothetical protein M0P97_00555 [Candidatus Moranbacteria bacterium]|jgi:hypothetical protein|nr:hypothetical protein [Candidatus Moranbacteria bacterium]
METKKIVKHAKCVHCEKRKKEEDSQDEVNLAVLLALVPLMVLTLFSQLNLL